MHKNIRYIDLGVVDYQKAWAYQEEKVLEVSSLRKSTKSVEYLLLCEHFPVYTLGKSGNKKNLLVNEQLLKQKKIQFVKTNRGGDITYHAPGQLVGYPIIDLSLQKLGVKKYIEKLEDCIIEFLKTYGLHANRKQNVVGLWVKCKKICSIGVRVNRGITMHGFALNINNDLKNFSYINPCGFINESITSMQVMLKSKLNMQETKVSFRDIFFHHFS